MDRIKFIFLYFSISLSLLVRSQQIGNYVNNGSFEELRSSCNVPAFVRIMKYWSAIDTTLPGFMTAHTSCTNNPLLSSCDYQYSRTGNGFVMNSIYIGYYNNRAYFRNELKDTLVNGVTYCVKYYVNVRNCSTYGIDAYGVYFGDSSLDTITQPFTAKTYLTPQVNNPLGNYVIDTLNWTTLSGTFTAVGNEKFLVIGNFKDTSSTGIIAIVQPSSNAIWCDVNIDDVSVIPVNLLAYAGPDKSCFPGDSVFIGRELDFAIDPGCIWYKLPNLTTAIDTISGLWVKPTTTSTYVVRQELDCSPLKWDTVVVFIDEVGLQDLKWHTDNINLFPNPTTDNITISFTQANADIRFYSIINNLGQTIREAKLVLKDKAFTLQTSDLDPGIYQVQFKTSAGTVTKQFVKN